VVATLSRLAPGVIQSKEAAAEVELDEIDKLNL
jgi:hypothetical protein